MFIYIIELDPIGKYWEADNRVQPFMNELRLKPNGTPYVRLPIQVRIILLLSLLCVQIRQN